MDGERGIFDCVLVCEFSDLKNMKNETLLYLYFVIFYGRFAHPHTFLLVAIFCEASAFFKRSNFVFKRF
jgi:hypothetical protein